MFHQYGETMINKDFNSILELLKEFSDEQICIDHLTELRWNGDVISPFDYSSKVYVCKGNKYQCKNTGKYFNVRTGTMFDNTKVPLQKWFLAIWLITSHKKGISSVQLSKDIDVTQKTAWFMLQRIRNCFGMPDNTELDGTVEADETFIGGKNKNRHADKKVENSQGRSYKDKTPVMGLTQRSITTKITREHKIVKGRMVIERIVIQPAKVFCRVVPNTKVEEIQPILKRVVKENSRLISDEWSAYLGLGSLYDHFVVNHSIKEYVNPDDKTIHSNTMEGFWTTFKRGVIGIYHKVSRKHLQMYANEFTFRYNTIHHTETSRFNLMLASSSKRLTYKSLING